MGFSGTYVWTPIDGEHRGNSDRQLYRCDGRLIFVCTIDGKEYRIELPDRFESDFVSAIDFFRWILGEIAGHKLDDPAAVHDLLCQCHGVDKKLADRIFLAAMDINGVPFFARYPTYWYVRLRGERTNWPQPGLTPVMQPNGLVWTFKESVVPLAGPLTLSA